jgi:uncharacterized protein YukE
MAAATATRRRAGTTHGPARVTHRAAADSWPRTTPQIAPWTARYDSRLVHYLEWFGTVVVACTGEPDRLKAEARLWDQLGRDLRAVQQRLTDSLAAAATWQGQAADTYRTAHLELAARLDDEVYRLPQVAAALRTGRDGLRTARIEAVKVTQLFLTDVQTRTASIRAATPALAASMTSSVIEQTFQQYRPRALRVVATLRAVMRSVDERLQAATPNARGLSAWLSPELTRRGVRVILNHENPIGSTELTMGVVGGVLNVPAEVIRQRGRMASPLGWALSTLPAGVIRNVASYADLPFSDNELYQLPATVGVNWVAVYGSNGVMKLINKTAWATEKFGAGTMFHDTPGKLLVNNSITSLLLAGKQKLYQVFPGMRPELITESGDSRPLTNDTALANNYYDMGAIGGPAAAIFGWDAYSAMRGKGLLTAAGAGVQTAAMEAGVATVAVAIGEDMYRPPEPGSTAQRWFDNTAAGWRVVQEHPATIATGAAMSALSSEADYLGATVQRLRHVPQVGELIIMPDNSVAQVTEQMARDAQVRYQQAVELQRRSLEDLSTAGRAMTDNVGALLTGRR